MVAALVTYAVSIAVLALLVWRQVSRDERAKNATAEPQVWKKGVKSLNAFRDRTRRLHQKYRA